MKNIGRNLKLGILIAVMIVITVFFIFIYAKTIAKVNTLNQNISDLEFRLKDLTTKNEMKETYNYELKYINYEMSRLQKILPPDIIQERVILSLRRMEKASGAKITSVQFSPVSKATSSKTTTTTTESSSSTKENESTTDQTNTTEAKATKEAEQSSFKDGDQLEMKVEVNFRSPYNELKTMLKEISREENKVIINNIKIERNTQNSKALVGKLDLTFCALKDSKRTMKDWELQLEKGLTDLFLPFDGYTDASDVILPTIEAKYKTEDITSDFYLLASPFNQEKPAVLIGKYEAIDSETYYDGNNTIDLNLYIEEKDGQLYYRTRTKQMPFPDEKNLILFYPKQEDITMNILASSITGSEDKVRVKLNVFNNTYKNLRIYLDDLSERVSIVVMQGSVSTTQKALH